MCNGTSVARFPTDTPSCSPSLWQLSQLLTNIPYDIIKKKINSFSDVALLLPFLPVSSSSSFHTSSEMDKGQLLLLLVLSVRVLVALPGSPAGQICSGLTLQLFSTGTIILNPSPLTGY